MSDESDSQHDDYVDDHLDITSEEEAVESIGTSEVTKDDAEFQHLSQSDKGSNQQSFKRSSNSTI